MKGKIILIVVLALAGAGTWYLLAPPPAPVDAASRRVREKDGSSSSQTRQDAASTTSQTRQDAASTTSLAQQDAASTAATAEQESPQADEEQSEAAAEAKVEAFDNLTDKWTEPAKTGVTMKDVDAFVRSFRQLPKDRRDECIHRALNLVPDENVMLLAGVLTDKSMDKEIVETVFNDILNRDEDVKKPILKQIFKDKSHPCWADVAWILDVTGETPSVKR